MSDFSQEATDRRHEGTVDGFARPLKMKKRG
jgi:hypothetical protein